MTDPTFDFSAFLTSPGGGSTLAARAGINKMDVGGPVRELAGPGPPSANAADMSTVLAHGTFGPNAAPPSVGIFDTNNDLFDVPWDSLAPFADPLVAASVPPAEIDDPLLDAFRTNDLLAKSKAQDFHGPMVASASTDMVVDSNVPSTMMDHQNGAPAGPQFAHAQQMPTEHQQTFHANGAPANPSTSYRAQILAHHSHLMRNGLGGTSARNGLPWRPMQGMVSAPSVPLSQSAQSRAMQVADQAGQLSLQERTRLARMEQSKARKMKGPAENVQVSGRAQKRAASGADTTMATPTQQQPAAYDVLNEQQMMNAASVPNVSTGPVANPPDSVYSSSGFDMLKALMRVASRPNPCVIIGPVDLSCSFTVSDAMHPDQPLIYCSDTFCRLTGYERSEIYGRNCRFLQSPDGIVEQGSERASTDNQAVAHLSKHVEAKKECQASLINYRKDGQPFINLVTIVPITWDETNQIRYLVGFQVDLVEQPGAILEKMPDGSYFVNYSSVSVGIPPSVVTEAPAPVPMSKQPSAITTVEPIDLEQQDAQARTANAQSIAEILDNGHNDTKHWSKLLLDNSHDLIYVLSLKGTFLYVSPSVERILGYKPSEVIGRSISEFTHPSDVVPVFRELKDSTSNASIAAAARASRAHANASSRYRHLPIRDLGPTVNLSFRMRTKDASHLWIESIGKLHLEQGKGRKVVVSSGRLRPQYHLASNVMSTVASSKEPGFWSKISHDGLFLNVTAPVINMLGITAHNMAGKTFKDLCDPESLGALTQALHTPATTLVLHALKDSMANKVAVLSTFYPSSVPVESAHETVWVHMRRAPPKLALQANVVYSAPAQEGDPNDASDPSVFAELSPHRSSSWCYELHQLRNLNKRLKEQVRAAHQRRASISQVDTSAANQSARLTDAAMKDMMYPASAFNPAAHNTTAPPNPRSAPPARLMPPEDNRARGDSSSSGELSTPVYSLLGGSGSNTDSTRSTSMSTNATPSNGESSESASRGSTSGGSSGEGAESEERKDAAQAKLKPRKRRLSARQPPSA